MTTKSPVPFYPDMFDLDITPPPRRVPITVPPVPETTIVEETVPDEEPITETTTVNSSPARSETTGEADTTTTSASLTNFGKSLESNKSEVVEGRRDANDDDSDKLIYSAENITNDTVKIVLSTLSPKSPLVSSNIGEEKLVKEPNNPIDQLSEVSPQKNTKLSINEQCPPRKIRALSWGWTRAGTVAIMPCPPGTAGLARWSCGGVESDRSGPAQWGTPSPDLGQCQSNWMRKIHEDLKKTESVVNIANDLVQYIEANPLYGGDVKLCVIAMGIIAEKMHFQLSSIPTQEQKEAVVMEIVQSIVKTASILLSDHMLPAWQDLHHPEQMKFLSQFLKALENTGTLLPKVLSRDREASISSQNIRMYHIQSKVNYFIVLLLS